MKTLVPVTLAVFAGLCNIPLIYGFKKAYSQNPFIFAGSFNLVSAFVFLSIAYLFGGIEHHYFVRNWPFILFAALGIVLINTLAYYLINYHGASYWIVVSLSSMLIPGIIVGYFILKDRVNIWIVPSIIFAILSAIFFVLSKR